MDLVFQLRAPGRWNPLHLMQGNRHSHSMTEQEPFSLAGTDFVLCMQSLQMVLNTKPSS